MSIVKATPKKFVIIFLIIIDCVFGYLVISSLNDKEKITTKTEVKTEGNYIVVDKVFNLDIKELEKKQIEENKKEEVKEEIVYDGLTLNQLGAKLDKSLKGKLKGKGKFITSYALKKGVDPYVAVAIILHETGCEWKCSTLVTSCNNVGGQKGSGCGSYARFSTLDNGIKSFINNLSKNYYKKGLNTPEKMGRKYAASTSWAKKVNAYVRKIKSK